MAGSQHRLVAHSQNIVENGTAVNFPPSLNLSKDFNKGVGSRRPVHHGPSLDDEFGNPRNAQLVQGVPNVGNFFFSLFGIQKFQ